MSRQSPSHFSPRIEARARRRTAPRTYLPGATIAAVILAGCIAAGAGITNFASPEPRPTEDATGADPSLTTGPSRTTAAADPHATAISLQLIDQSAEVPAYRRADFGEGWIDVDGNGCSTRQDVLQRDLARVTLADDGCTVLRGALTTDPYTGTTIAFSHDRVGGDSQAVQIDHIISLSAAHRGGAWAWSPAARVAFANDPSTLLAVDGSANASKSDLGPAQWMPEDPGFWCEYAARYTAIASHYSLAVSPPDRQMLVDVLDACA